MPQGVLCHKKIQKKLFQSVIFRAWWRVKPHCGGVVDIDITMDVIYQFSVFFSQLKR